MGEREGKNNKGPEEERGLNLLLCGQPWALGFMSEMRNVCGSSVNVESVHFSI